jgi:predicted permease
MLSALKQSIRQLTKSPAFTLTVVLTLALGIGANTAIFSVVHAVLLAPLPYPESERLVTVLSRNQQRGVTGQGFAPAGFREFEKQATAFEAVAAGRYNYVNLTRIEKPTQLTDMLVTRQFFDVLGVKPLLGRTFAPEDAAAGAKPVVILSHAVWQTYFGGRPQLVGDTITLDDTPHTVIGVMPPNFKEPANIASAWRVFPNEGGENLATNGRFWFSIGRLKPGGTPTTAQPELATVSARFAQSDAGFYGGWDFYLLPLRDSVVGNYRDGLLLVIGAALLVLLVTCANVAGLQLVRASARQRDFAVRLAIGASRWALARGQLAESLVLVVLGGVGGAFIGKWGVDLLLASLSSGWIPRSDEIGVNLPVLAMAGGVALLTGLAFGVYPAFRATKVDAVEALRDGAKGSASRQSLRTRSALVAGQIALTLVLLVCAGLVVKSFATILRVNPGMQVDNVLSLNLYPSAARYNTGQKRADYYREIIERVAATPGVEGAAITSTMPFTWGIPLAFTVVGRPDDADKLPQAFYDSVSVSFFPATRIPLIAGRVFTDKDTSQTTPVIVISQSTAKKFFPNENPIGKLLLPPRSAPQAPAPKPLEIVGIVGDVPRNGLNANTPYQVYAPLEQRPFVFGTLLVHARSSAAALTTTVQKQIWSLNPDQPISNIALVKTLVRASVTQPQLYLTLFSLFAVLALLLAALGIYGLVAYTVEQRTREFGIRFALGAQREDVIRLVLTQGAKLAGIGLALGLAAAAASARLMESLLFHTTAYDPLVFAIVVAVLAVVSLLAALLPARRAARVDPMVALRAE